MLRDLTLGEFVELADSYAPLSPFPPPSVAMAYRLAAQLPLGLVAAYCGCSYKSLERAERGVFNVPRSISRERYAKVLRACESWLATNKPGTLNDIENLWRDIIDANRKAG